MSKLNSSRRSFIEKRKKALTKLNSFLEKFEKKQKEVKADLEEAGLSWRKIGKKFKWWQTLP